MLFVRKSFLIGALGVLSVTTSQAAIVLLDKIPDSQGGQRAPLNINLFSENPDPKIEAGRSKARDYRSVITDIYHDIILRYSWPTVTMYFHQFSQQEKSDYLAALEQERGVEKFIQQKIDFFCAENNLCLKHKMNFSVQDIPNTLFDMAAILEQFRYFDEKRTIPPETYHARMMDPDPKKHVYNSIVTNFFDVHLEKKLKEMPQAPDTAERRGKLMIDIFEPWWHHKGVTELYVRICAQLHQALQKQDSLNFLMNQTRDFLKNKSIFFEDEFALYVQYYNESIKSRGVFNYLLNPKILQDAIEHEQSAINKNQFLLFRGANIFKPDNSDNSLIDFPGHLTPKAHEAYIKSLGGISAPLVTGLQNPKNDSLKDNAPGKYHSLSFGYSLLAGTLFEGKYRGGARAFDIMKQGQGYALNVRMKDYLQSWYNGGDPASFFWIPPTAWLSFYGEYWHPRIKVAIDKEDEIKIINSGKEIDSYVRPYYVLAPLKGDFEKLTGLYILRPPQESRKQMGFDGNGPAFSGRLAEYFANHINFIGNDLTEQEQNNLKDNLRKYGIMHERYLYAGIKNAVQQEIKQKNQDGEIKLNPVPSKTVG